jgi:outer membrane protein OmpA-like peptidoglycan-associated protein
MNRIASVILSLCLAGLFAGPALAENPNVNMNDFYPSPHAYDIGHVMGTRVAPSMDLNGGLWMTYRNKALGMESPTGTGSAQLIKDQLVADLYVALGLFDLASVGLDIPVFFMSSGDDPTGVMNSFSTAKGAAFGDVRLAAKMKFWNNENKGFGLGIAEDVTLPTATSGNFAGEDGVTSRTNLILDYNKSGWGFFLNAGLLARPEYPDFVPPVSNELIFAAAAQVPIVCDTVELLLASNTRTALDDPFGGEGVTGTTILGGLKVRPVNPLLITAMGGSSIGTLPGVPAWEAMLQVGFESKPSSCDLDGDGICDSQDKCPSVQGPKESQGCPDKDGDGILDSDDKCPTVPGKDATAGCPDRDNDNIADHQDACPDQAGKFELKGCPDQDNDGIPDGEDQCPTKAGEKSAKGCPDKDGDGFIDMNDACPDEAGIASAKGCPDKDGDGIADGSDKCPDVWGRAEFEGCPPPTPKKVQITAKKIVIMDKVFFETNKAKIKPESFGILKDVAKVLKDNAWVKSVEVQGHTDDVGKESQNMKLSQARAEAVRDFLVKEGVETGRLVPVGYGPTKPLVNEKTADARAQNRRVEFIILDPK